MPPKLNDGGFVPYEQLFFADGRPVTIGTAELPPEPEWEPPDFSQMDYSFSVDVFIPRKEWRRSAKRTLTLINRIRRFWRSYHRQREKERRRKLKEANR